MNYQGFGIHHLNVLALGDFDHRISDCLGRGDIGDWGSGAMLTGGVSGLGEKAQAIYTREIEFAAQVLGKGMQGE